MRFVISSSNEKAVICENKGELLPLFYFRLFVRRRVTAVRSLSDAPTDVCVWDVHCEKIIKHLPITTRMSLCATRTYDNNELSSDRQHSYMPAPVVNKHLSPAGSLCVRSTRICLRLLLTNICRQPALFVCDWSISKIGSHLPS